MNTQQKVRVQASVERIKHKLLALGPLRPGSLSRQWNVCGKKDCRCKNVKRPRKHGPYYQLSYTWRGKSRTVFVSEDQVSEVKRQIANYRRFRALCQQWVDAALVVAHRNQTLRKRQRTSSSPR